MPHIYNKMDGGTQSDGPDFRRKTMPTSDARIRLERLEPPSEWPDPDLSVLRLNRRPPPQLPVETLEEAWAQWAEHAARAAVAPVDYVVAPPLAAASAVIGHARWARAWSSHARWARAWEDWTEPPHLWCAAVGDSGDGKSPGADAVYRRMAADFPDRLREAQTAIEAAKAKFESWKDLVRTAVKDGHALPPQPDPVPREPLAPRLVLSDVTIERVACLT